MSEVVLLKGAMMDAWYFAYGSNLCVRQLVARVGAISSAGPAPRIATLAHHRLVFQRLSMGGPAYANILSPGDGVFGVVYRMSDEQLVRLDRYESGYDRLTFSVIDQQRNVLSAETYVMRPALVTGEGPPSAAYLETILRGAREHGFEKRDIAPTSRRA